MGWRWSRGHRRGSVRHWPASWPPEGSPSASWPGGSTGWPRCSKPARWMRPALACGQPISPTRRPPRRWPRRRGTSSDISTCSSTTPASPCAGRSTRLSVDDGERVMRVNYLSPVAMTLAVLPRMIEQGSGTVVNVSSLGGRLGIAAEAAYSASKFALCGFSEVMARRSGRHRRHRSPDPARGHRHRDLGPARQRSRVLYRPV